MKVLSLLAVAWSLLAAGAVMAESQNGPTDEIESCGPIEIFLADRLQSRKPAYAHLSSSNQNAEKKVMWTLEIPNSGSPLNQQEDWTDRVKVKTLKVVPLEKGSFHQETGLGSFKVVYTRTSRQLQIIGQESLGFPEFLTSDVTGQTNGLTVWTNCLKKEWYNAPIETTPRGGTPPPVSTVPGT